MSIETVDQALPLVLKELKLPAFERHWQPLLEPAAQQSWPPSRYLLTLGEYELAERYRKRVHRLTQEAKLPADKTLSSLDAKALPKAVMRQLNALASQPDWALQANNVLFFGPSGVGKTHAAAALGHALIERGLRVRFFAATALVQHLQKARRELELMKAMTRLDKYRVMILDDIGYVRKTDAETQVLFEFIAHRYESASLILTSNQPFSQWDEVFPDSMMTVAAIDRLVHHAAIIDIQTQSYRKKSSQQRQQRDAVPHPAKPQRSGEV